MIAGYRLTVLSEFVLSPFPPKKDNSKNKDDAYKNTNHGRRRWSGDIV